MEINIEKIRQQVSLGLVFAILIYIVFLTVMTVAFFFDMVSPDKIPSSDWWAALGIVVTLTFAILVMNFIREKTLLDTQNKLDKDYLDTQKKIDRIEEEIQNTKQLSTLSTIILDIATEENSNKDKWKKNYIYLENLFNLGFISNTDLYRISLQAWQQNEIDFAFRLRYLGYKQNMKDLTNKLYFLSIVAYIDIDEINPDFIDNDIIRIYNEPDFFLKEVGFSKSETVDTGYSVDNFFNLHENISNSNECFAYALTGRYLFRKKMYSESRIFFELAIDKSVNFRRWHFRYLIEILLYEKDFDALSEKLSYIKNKQEWREDFRYIAFHNLLENIINIINGNPVNNLNFLILLKGVNQSHFDRFTMWNFTSLIDNLELEHTKTQIIFDIYKKYYVFFGSDDSELEDKFAIVDFEVEKESYLNVVI